MTRKARFSTALFFLFFGLTGCAKPPTLEDRLVPFQGEWTVVHVNQAGKVFDDDDLKEMSVTIQKDHFQLSRSVGQGDAKQEHTEECQLQIDPSKPVGDIDFVYLAGKDYGKVRPGIYSREDNKLKLCMAVIDGKRPTEFTGTATPPITLIILQHKQ